MGLAPPVNTTVGDPTTLFNVPTAVVVVALTVTTLAVALFAAAWMGESVSRFDTAAGRR